jgi:MerR HTH family regulatory protein
MSGKVEVLTLEELAGRCRTAPALVIEWVELGWLRPADPGPDPASWHFTSEALLRLRTVSRLARELDLPAHAAVLVAELIEERRRLERRAAALERLFAAED